MADQFHYGNVLIGTRAVGLGGAFGAVADDASGVYYNPAGLAFALSNDISGSANAFYTKESKYKSTLCGEDFVEASSGSVPSFFGGLQKLDRYVEGLRACASATCTRSPATTGG
jgi:long-chain fatty acid transport protein